ncbi:hypothetical protein ACJX0J_042602 [Zea mays]
MKKIHVNYITLVIFLLTCLQREQDPEKKYPHRAILYIHTHKNPHVALFQIQNNRMKHLNVTTLDETSSEDVQYDTILDLQHTSQQAPSSSDISEKLYPQITVISIAVCSTSLDSVLCSAFSRRAKEENNAKN